MPFGAKASLRMHMTASPWRRRHSCPTLARISQLPRTVLLTRVSPPSGPTAKTDGKVWFSGKRMKVCEPLSKTSAGCTSRVPAPA